MADLPARGRPLRLAGARGGRALRDCDELDIRIPATAFLRPFNVLGWAAIAIGDLQFSAPRDETVLAAALAWDQLEA